MNSLDNNPQAVALTSLQQANAKIGEAAREIAKENELSNPQDTSAQSGSFTPNADDSNTINENMIYMMVNKQQAMASIQVLNMDDQAKERILSVMA